MDRSGTADYAVWQQVMFWMGWGMLCAAGMFLWHIFSLVGYLVWVGSRETVDLTLTVILGTALIEVLLVGIHTLMQFWWKEYSFGRLSVWLLAGMLVIPLVAIFSSLYSIYTLTM